MEEEEEEARGNKFCERENFC